jgi:hypothetical protein
METVVPLMPCKSLPETLDFYRTLGFEVTHEQTNPYVYGAVSKGDVHLHFSTLSAYGAKNAFGACLVMVQQVALVHRRCADALRTRFGRVPTAGFPRITRFGKQESRFKLFDPSGNMLIYIDQDESYSGYLEYQEDMSPMAQALDTADFLRDTYSNDGAAAKVLDKALARNDAGNNIAGTLIERARVLAARAEIAVAIGETERAGALRKELQAMALPDAAREQYRDELQAADVLEHWLVEVGQ